MRISLEQALDILMDHVTQGRTERKPLEQCLGLVREFDTSKLKRILQSLETGLFFCQIFVFII